MWHNLAQLPRYRGLIQSLVARELKARYRGSVLGFFWSFVNPLLLLLIYSFVFKYVIPQRITGLDPYGLFLFCGLLPWTWFSTALNESSGVLISGGNLIKKVLFPAEVLPIVTVLAGSVHFCLGLPILAAFLLYYQVPVAPTDLLWFPVVVLIQLILTLGLALLLSALTVHFRDVRDLLSNLLTLWFFGTPIIYAASQVPPQVRNILNLNPMTHLVVSYQEILFTTGTFSLWPQLLVVGVASVAVFILGFFVFDRLRDTLAEEV
jgi:ABC-type polysaccharide/polyol phosphate export permease